MSKKTEENYYRKKYNDERDENIDLQTWRAVLIALIICSILITIIFTSKGLSLSRLDLRDEVLRNNFLKHYPEFEDCALIFLTDTKGVQVYCDDENSLTKRNGIKMEGTSSYDYKFYFYDSWEELIIEYKNDMNIYRMYGGIA